MTLDLPRADRRRLLRNDVFDHLLDAILSGELAPGVRIKDADLTGRLGVSRTPVREALGRLAAVGLVRSSPNRFTVVSPIDPHEILGAVDVLRVLYPEVLRAFAEAANPDAELELALLAARFERDADASALAHLRRVARTVLGSLDNTVLSEAVEAVQPRVARFLFLECPSGGAAGATVIGRAEALALTAAVAKRDHAAARLVAELLDRITAALDAHARAGG